MVGGVPPRKKLKTPIRIDHRKALMYYVEGFFVVIQSSDKGYNVQLKKLGPSFYTDNTHLIQSLDFINGAWQAGKIRGYGIVVVSINNLTFGIPLRSNIKHDACYVTVRSNIAGIKGKGLDFSKAVLLKKPSHISPSPFRIPSDEFSKLKGKAAFITNKFEKYVERYVKAVGLNDGNILNSDEFRFSTLINYHSELGI